MDTDSRDRMPFVQEACLQLAPEIDPASVGAAVTVELCGHWEHEGTCRWPHNNDISVGTSEAVFRTLFISAPRDESAVRERIMRALQGAAGVKIIEVRSRAVAPSESVLAENLLRHHGAASN